MTVGLSFDALLLGAISGLKIAVFLLVLVYAFLVDIPFKRKSIHWINLTAIALILIAIMEFLHAMSDIGMDHSFIPYLDSEANLNAFIDIMSIVAGIGLLMFLLDIKKNIAAYK